MILGIIGISITLLFALLAGSNSKKVVLPILGVVGLTALSILAGMAEYGIPGKGIGEWDVFLMGLCGVCAHPLILQLFVRHRTWSGLHLTLFALVNTLINLYIFQYEYLKLVFRLGLSIPYALYTPLAIAVWMGIIAVRDEFSFKGTVGTAVSTAAVTYLPIAVFGLWKLYLSKGERVWFDIMDAGQMLWSALFLFIGFIVLFLGTALGFHKLRARRQVSVA